jgi:AraC-like DNA-binding protein
MIEEIFVREEWPKNCNPRDFSRDYFVHVFCQEGQGQFLLEGKKYQLQKNNFVIWLPLSQVEALLFSPDFKATYLFVSFELMSKNNPDISWGIKGFLFSKENPVLPLSAEVFEKCLVNVLLIQEKSEGANHRFRKELINLQLQIFVMEMWNIFADQMELRFSSTDKGSLFERFLQLVQKHCLVHREVEFYSDLLAITPKYLTEVCKKASGKTASEWIQNYTVQRLIILLKNPKLTFTEIADTLHFSSQSFFSRYVKKNLGQSPSEFRQRLSEKGS